MTKRGVLVLTLLLSISSTSLSADSDTGVLDDGNPYGLSESERTLIQNRKLSMANKRKIEQNAMKIDEMQEAIEGLRSVVDSLSQKLGQTGQKISELDANEDRVDKSELEALKRRVDELENRIDSNFKKLSASIKKLTKLISSSPSIDTTPKVSPKPKAKKEKKLSNSELLKKAISLYRKKRYDDAKEIFEKLAKKSYKPATANYYLGEIAYYQKRYEEAIVFYKKSVGFYDKASYMPTLLLHTALSFKHMDDIENSNLFFQTIIDSYPDSPQAKIAKRYLD